MKDSYVRTDHDLVDVAVLCASASEDAQVHAAELARFLGAEVAVLSTSAVTAGTRGFADALPKCACLVLNAETLVQVLEQFGTVQDGLGFLAKSAPNIFVYGFHSRDRHNHILRVLSKGALSGVEPCPGRNSNFQISSTQRDWCQQFSGLQIASVDPKIDRCFVEAHPRSCEPLISIDRRPFAVPFNFGGAQWLLSSCLELADLDAPVLRDDHLTKWFSRLVPMIMLLKKALGKRGWRGGSPRACLIIDDPLLKRRHGFLRYQSMLEATERRHSFTSIAFIPWNYDRSNQQVVDMISAAESRAGLCVHGCDHGAGEFAKGSVSELQQIARLALDRMEAHRARYGLGFDPVMVFPQGLFSPEAMNALNASGYLAAINTDPHPSTVPETLKLRDLLDVAVTSFANFPLFVRRYPSDVAGFAFDLFLGKPVLAVEHHGFFRNGDQALEDFVSTVRTLDERLEWTSPAVICSTACVMRTDRSGEIHVRFASNQFRLKNEESATCIYVLLRRWPASSSEPTVTVGGRPWRFERLENQLAIRVTLEPGEEVGIAIMTQAPSTDSLPRPLRLFNFGISLRRLLCEIRDNYVDTVPVLSRIVTSVRRRINAGRTESLDVWGRPESRVM